ncbi:MAG: hypothetical protein RIT45_1310 [Pseudomonadota bacterium]|jgi:hypothetical protein
MVRSTVSTKRRPFRSVRRLRWPIAGLGLLVLLASLAGCGEAGSATTTSEQDAIGQDAWDADDGLAAADIGVDTETNPSGDDADAVDAPVEPTPTGPPEPTILAVAPGEGPIGGMFDVEITGEHLGGTIAVYFGESPALEVLALDPWTVRATAPPRPAGWVDVTARSLDADGNAVDTTLPMAFRYVSKVAVHAVEPATGDAEGGTLVTVQGEGFEPNTRFVFGDRQAIAPLVIDEHTATMHTPPGAAGRVDVVAATIESAATLEDGFEYVALPRIDAVSPGVVGLPGGKVRLHGSGLQGAGGVVSVYLGAQTALATILASAPDGSWIDVQAPALGSAGPRGVRYSRKGAMASLDAALTYASFIDPTTGKSQQNAIAAVVPGAVPANQGAEVAIHVVGPIAAATTGQVQVLVGGVPVPLLDGDIGTWTGPQPGATVRVQVPPTVGAAPGWQDVQVEVGFHQAFAAKALERTSPVPEILAVQPERLEPAGGTAVTVQWGPTTADTGPVIGLRIGALWAGNVTEAGPGTVTAIAPQGSPGPATVTLVFAKTQATLAGAVQYGGTPEIAAVVPSRGAQAGGTLVRLVGSSLDRLDRAFFGQKDVADIIPVHAGLALVRTPSGDPGTVSVEGWFQTPGVGKTISVLQNAFTYYDPQAGNYGTWGGRIDGALDVTVLRSNLGVAPVEGALVVVQQPGKPQRTALTDERGQVTISELDLNGPLMVSAGKQGHSAASLVAADSRHVTLRIRKLDVPPPAQGDGGGEGEDEPDPFPDGAIEGVVTNADKYRTLPLGNCTKTPQIGGNCQPCETNLDCPGTLSCEALLDPLAGFSLGAADSPGPDVKDVPRICAAPCTDDAHCPTGYDCRATAWMPGEVRLRCMPTIGEAQVRCETSSPSMFGGNPNPGPLATAAANGAFRIDSRLGDVAVACFAGYVPKGGGAFVRLAMGLRRSVTVYPGQTTPGVKVTLDTPMTRRMTVELQKLPMGPDTLGMERAITAALDLDAEGYIRVADVETTVVTDRLVLERQPVFSGVNATIPWTFYGSIAPQYGGSPVAVAIREKLLPTVAEQLLTWPAGASKPAASSAYAPRVRAGASDGAMSVAVGDGGYIGTWSGAALTQQPSPTARDLFAVWMDPLGSGVGFAGGEHGTLLRRDPVEGWKATFSPVAAPAGQQYADADRIVAIAGGDPDDVWLLDGANRLWRGGVAGFVEVPSPMATPTAPTQTWPPKPTPPRLRAMTWLPDGALVVVGDGGFMARAKVPAKGTPPQWLQVVSSRDEPLHGVWGTGWDSFWVCGGRGALGRVTLGTPIWLDSGTDEALFGIAGGADGLHVVGGAGTWIRVDLGGQISTHADADVALDLRAVLPAVAESTGPSPGWVAFGEPILRMGPYLELPYYSQPLFGDDIGEAVEWTTAGGLTPTLNMLRIASYDYTTRWEIFLRGDTQRVDLPDFQALGGFNPVPPGKLRLRLWRIYAPGLEIDHFNHKQLSVWQWVSYAFNTILVNLPQSVGPMPDALPPQTPPPTPSPAPEPPWSPTPGS